MSMSIVSCASTSGKIWQMPVAIALTWNGPRLGMGLWTMVGGGGMEAGGGWLWGLLEVLEGATEGIGVGTGVGGGGTGGRTSFSRSSSDMSCSQAWVMLRRKLLSWSTSNAICVLRLASSSSGMFLLSRAEAWSPMPVLTTDLSTPHLLFMRLPGLSGAILTHFPGLTPTAIASMRDAGGRKMRARSGMLHSLSTPDSGLRTASPAASLCANISSMSNESSSLERCSRRRSDARRSIASPVSWPSGCETFAGS
mmetsp:Transcript_30400/g.72008  ORF Transcript_30400/g.72008 Transcript_30400/m.72008 type:complete len:253 (-) Transcript_30400:150-908(-)